eukprot:TRINITY_DN32921_c0_g1_i1.p1 TRINITY_DN32921_c0_g1~~TRINITY_DN32921_c0_g1_i1.p1  ORF type:complete len:286 (+),score=108.16 TRINITY_DN32921_c0_g1_i1:76-858(+)
MAKKVGVARLRKELVEFYRDPPPLICVAPNEKNMLDWDYLLQGPEGTPYEGGEYHGRIRFPAEYPLAPPEIMMYTPNGRFKTNVPLCLSMSNFHPESWNPAWSVATILKGLLSFMVEETPTEGSITPPLSAAERRVFTEKTKEHNSKNPNYRKLFPDGFIYPEKDEEQATPEQAAPSSSAPAAPEDEPPAPSQTPAPAPPAPAPAGELGVGARVTLQNMAARPDLNGAAGVVEALAGARFQVKLDNGEVVKVRKNVLALA